MLRIVDAKLLKRDDQRCPYAGNLAQPTEVGGSVLEAKVLFDV